MLAGLFKIDHILGSNGLDTGSSSTIQVKVSTIEQIDRDEPVRLVSANAGRPKYNHDEE